MTLSLALAVVLAAAGDPPLVEAAKNGDEAALRRPGHNQHVVERDVELGLEQLRDVVDRAVAAVGHVDFGRRARRGGGEARGGARG